MLNFIIYIIKYVVCFAISLIIIRVIMDIANLSGNTIRKFIGTEIKKHRSKKRDN